MISRDFPVRLWLASLTALALLGGLAACTSSDDGRDRPASPTTTRPSPKIVTSSYSLDVGESDGPDVPDVRRVGDTTVTAYDTNVRGFGPTGKRTWAFTKPAAAEVGYGLGVAVRGEHTVLIWKQGRDYVLRVVDTQTGQQRWTYRTSGYFDTVADTVLASACNRDDTRCTLRALELGTGALRWSRTLTELPYPITDEVDDSSGPAAIVVGVGTGPEDADGLQATASLSFDLATGRSRRVAVPNDASLLTQSANLGVFTTYDDKPENGCTTRLITVDVRTGARVWERAYPVDTDPDSSGQCGRLASVPEYGSVAVHPKGAVAAVLEARSGRTLTSIGSVKGRIAARSGAVSYLQRELSDQYGKTGKRTVTAVRDGGERLWSRTQRGASDDVVAIVGRLLLFGNGRTNQTSAVIRTSSGAVVGEVAGKIAGYGSDWVAGWDGEIVRVYKLRA